MIIVKLKGGLGNQMFQYAFGKALGKRLNQRLYFDDTLLTGRSETTSDFTARKFELSLFPDIDLSMLSGFLKTALNSKTPVLTKFNNKMQLIKYFIQEENEYFQNDGIQLKAINIFDGYFQSQNYFRNYSNIIRSDFRFPPLDAVNNSVRDKVINSNSVAVHIRRGDYFSNPGTFRYHGILPVDYYKKAIEIVRNTHPEVYFFIFTDDVSWAKSSLLPTYPEAIIVEGNIGSDSWKDMALMTYAKHHIISNSSFSWWGAWLAEDKGIKIAPGQWFNTEVAKFDIHTIIPQNWTILY